MTLLIALITAVFLCGPLVWGVLRFAAISVPKRIGILSVVILLLASGAAAHYALSDNAAKSAQIALYEDDPSAAMDALASQIRARLEAEGSAAEAQGYFLLARTLEAAGRRDAAIDAYQQANDIAENLDPDLLVSEAEARLNRASDGDDLEQADALVQAALRIAPDHPAANFFAGALALRRGQSATALPHLRVVADSDLLGPEARMQLEQRIAELSNVDDESGDARAETALPLTVSIQLAPGLGDAENGSGTLFVFLQRTDGPAMPLAARRIDAPRFPLTITLSGSDRIGAVESPLPNREALAVGARWSSTGDARGAAGDPSGRVALTGEAETELRLELQR